MQHPTVTVHADDVARLRELAQRVRAHAESPQNQELCARWYALDEGTAAKPLLLTETDGGLEMVLPEYRPQCREPWAQQQERWLMTVLAHVEIIGDDFPLTPYVPVRWRITMSDYGVPISQTLPSTAGQRGAYHINPALQDLEREFDRLRPRTFTVDREGTAAEIALLSEVYDGILGVRLRGNPWWTLGLTYEAIKLIGLEELMLYMYDQPEALHRLMAFLRDDRLALLNWMECEQLFVLNNEDDYLGSGSRGFTRRFSSETPVTTRNMWTLIESQETVGVGPDLYEEFVFQYERTIAEHFGGIYYGCCEPVHTRWDVLQQMPNLKRVSISPWCDQAYMAQALGGKYVYSRKPNPTLVSTEQFNEEAIREDVRTTLHLTAAHGCPTEIIMKDVHTLNNDPTRLTRWVSLAREEIDRIYGRKTLACEAS